MAGVDGGGLDSGMMDARPPPDSTVPVDGYMPMDAPPPIDAPGIDSGPPDSGPVDTGTPDVPMLPPTCNELFDSIPGYVRCDETATECEFFSNPPGELTCDELCDVGGQTCRGSWNEGYPGEPVCTRHEERGGCDDPGDAFLCRCTRGAP